MPYIVINDEAISGLLDLAPRLGHAPRQDGPGRWYLVNCERRDSQRTGLQDIKLRDRWVCWVMSMVPGDIRRGFVGNSASCFLSHPGPRSCDFEPFFQFAWHQLGSCDASIVRQSCPGGRVGRRPKEENRSGRGFGPCAAAWEQRGA